MFIKAYFNNNNKKKPTVEPCQVQMSNIRPNPNANDLFTSHFLSFFSVLLFLCVLRL